MNDKKTSESGLQRYTGIKKYGKKGFEELQKAGREGASEEEKGAIKDRYLKKKTNEGLADMAGMAERDHEVQMARAELYKIAKYAIKLHEMLKNVSEAEGIEGWQQAKITKAGDYLDSVFHSLEYDMKVMTPESKSKPDYIDLDKDGNKKEPMKKAAKDAKKTNETMDSYKAKLRAKLAEKTNERSLTKGEEDKREKYVKGMKKAKGDFKDRYGKDAEAVMYATATKMAKK